MLSDFTVKGIKFLVKGGAKLRLSVYAWDKSASHFTVTKSKLTWFLVILTQCYLLGQSGFEVYQMVRLVNDPNESFEMYMKLVLQWLTRLIAVIVQIDSLINGYRLAAFMNQIFILNARFKEVKGADKVKDTLKTLSRVTNIIAFAHPVLAVTGFLEDRYQSRYWHHLVIQPSIFPFCLPLIGFIEYMITASGVQCGIWYLFVGSIYFRTSDAWMQLVKKTDNMFGKEWKDDSVLLFRTMQVYNQIYNNRLATLWTFQMASVFLIEVLCVAMSIMLTPNMPFPSNMMFPVAGAGMVFYSTRIYKATTAACEQSEELERKFRTSPDKYKRAVGVSMKPLRVEVRPFFCMSKTTSFSFTSEVTDKVISILVAT